MDMTQLAELFGVSAQTTIYLVGLGVAATALAKEEFKLKGKMIHAVVGGLMVLGSLAVYQGDIVKVAASAVVSYIGATGGWSAVKQAIKKGEK